MIRVGIIGSTGYAGQELVRLLLGHKEAFLFILDEFCSYLSQMFLLLLASMFLLLFASITWKLTENTDFSDAHKSN